MKLSELLFGIGIVTDDERNVTGVVSDSREVAPGCVFVCIKGEEWDGHDFVLDAVGAGASAVIYELSREIGEIKSCPAFGVENARLCLALLLEKWHGDPGRDMKIIAVTGTNGKTSTAAFITAALSAAGNRVGTIGTVCCRVGDRDICVPPSGTHSFTTPDPARYYRILSEMKALRAGYVVTEASSHSISQYRLDGAPPDIAVFTNLSPEHLDFHGDMKSYFEAKARLFEFSRCGLVNYDSEYGRELKRRFPGVLTYGSSADADFRCADVRFHGSRGVSYRLCCPNGESFEIFSRIPGRFTLENTLAAASCALMCGITPKITAEGIGQLACIPGRMERPIMPEEPEACGNDIFMDYAHTPDALEKVLLSVREFRREGQRIILLFGCGGDRDRSKRAEMGRIATRLADLTVVTSDNPRSEPRAGIIADILRGLDREKPYKVIEDRRDAIFYAVSAADPGDIILLCGKGHEKYEIDSDGRHPFDEAEIVRLAVKERRNTDR